MSKAAAIIALLLLASDAHGAVECRASKGDAASRWAWRLVDGKRCWYRGRAGKDKRLLTWAKGEPPAMIDEPLPAPPAPVPWPEMPPPLAPTFHERWLCATRGDCR